MNFILTWNRGYHNYILLEVCFKFGNGRKSELNLHSFSMDFWGGSGKFDSLEQYPLLRFRCKAEHFKSLYYFHDKSVVASLQFEFVVLKGLFEWTY